MIVTTPKQLLAAYLLVLKDIGMGEPEAAFLAAANTNILIEKLRELKGE